jgi:hypothetical protein
LVALPVGGCGDETTATGGSGGSGDTRGDGGNGGSAGTGGMGGAVGSVACEGNVCTCSEAGIRAAIAAGGDDPYTFDCAGRTTVVTEAAIVTDADVILDGEGNLTVARDGTHTGFVVPEGVTVELHRLAVVEGLRGIDNSGTLTLNEVAVSDCQAGGKFGFAGGIRNLATGMVTMRSSTVSGNSADVGGGILNSGTMVITDSVVAGNYGGDIVNEGTMSLTRSTVSGSIWLSSPWTDPGSLTFTNTSIVGECGCFDGTTCDVTSGGHNVESPGDTCGFDHETDQVNVGGAR